MWLDESIRACKVCQASQWTDLIVLIFLSSILLHFQPAEKIRLFKYWKVSKYLNRCMVNCHRVVMHLSILILEKIAQYGNSIH